MLVNERFKLDEAVCKDLKSREPNFGFNGFGEATYFRTYSRIKPDGSQEHWADTVIRVIEGVFSIRKDHYIKNKLGWSDIKVQATAAKMAETMFEMKWLPPGRGLWAMGTDFVYRVGSAALNNCGATDTKDLVGAATWTMDMLMCGVGIGFNTKWEGGANLPDKNDSLEFVIPDSREGWVQSLELLLNSFIKGTRYPKFDYSQIRLAGEPIKGFGGVASGPEPLVTLHNRVEEFMTNYCMGKIDETRLTADIFNSIGACVVAGNVRRSAEIALGSPDDLTFLNLKNYEMYPERADIGWMSNNTVVLDNAEDFNKLPQIAEAILRNGEPGVCNLKNVQKYARYGDKKEDKAWLANPCSEIPLEDKELCNLAEVFPSRCIDEYDFYTATEYACFYASTVALLPTHRAETNQVIARNRRIGVSLSGITDFVAIVGMTEATNQFRNAYRLIVKVNKDLAKEAGVPESIRVTTVKPSGTISQLAGVSSGMHFPTFKYAIRRMRVGNTTPICQVLKDSGVPHEPDVFSAGTTVFSFPICNHNAREAKTVSAWEQFAILAMLQREWADNMVSCTIYFDPETEGPQIEYMLSQFVPVIKSVSMLPHTDNGAYPQMPYEGISKERYEELLAETPKIDWTHFLGSDGKDSKFCNNDNCEI